MWGGGSAKLLICRTWGHDKRKRVREGKREANGEKAGNEEEARRWKELHACTYSSYPAVGHLTV